MRRGMKGSTWTVTDTYILNGALIIQRGATAKAPDGDLLTLTVDGDGHRLAGKWQTRKNMFGHSITTFTPDMDAAGRFVTIGKRKYDRKRGALSPKTPPISAT